MPIEKIRDEHEYNLNISRYISTAQAEKEIDQNVTNSLLTELEAKSIEAATKHNKFLEELGLPLLPSSINHKLGTN